MTERALLPSLSGRSALLGSGLLTLLGLLGLVAGVVMPPGSYQSMLETRGLPLLAYFVAVWCGLIALLSALVDRFDGEHAARSFDDFGRIALGIGALGIAIAVALAVTRTRYPQDLFYGFKAVPAITIVAIILAVMRYLAQFGQAKAAQPAAPVAAAQSSPRRIGRTVLAVLLLGIAGVLLGERYREHLAHEAEEAAVNREERAKAPPWNYGINGFAAGTSEQEIRSSLSRAGYRVYCPRTLTSENKLASDDTANCWMLLKTAMGMPATVASFWFGERGLRAHMIRFEASAWSDVQVYLDRNGTRLAADFGTDKISGGPIAGWRFDNGIVMTTAPAAAEDITVTWTPKEVFVVSECSRRLRSAGRGQRQASVPVEKWWPGLDCGEFLTKP